MSNLSKNDKEKQKLLQEKCQTALNIMLRDEDNRYCVDCDAKGPRWASWNLGVFLCIRCAGIHRNLGVHISKVKSVNLDSWTPEQVVSMQQMGNSRARAVYEANLPDNFRRPQNDSAIEQFVRQKYEQKKYIAREYVPSALPKVDWEAEIEAELRRKREKKKGDSTPPPTKVEMPAKVTLPERVPTPPSKPKAKSNEPPKNNSADDLLGLDVGTVNAPVISTSRSTNLDDDIFGVFVNANSSSIDSQPPTTQASSASKEESDFFNQPLGEKKPMDKDSILALYGKSTPQMNPAFGQQVPTGVPQGFGYGAATGMLPNQGAFGVPVVGNPGMVQAQQALGGMGVSSQFGLQNSLHNSAFSGLPMPAMGANPFLQNQMTQLQSQMSGVSIGSGLGQTQQGVSHFGNGFVFPNGLSQQANGQTLSNNLWQ